MSRIRLLPVIVLLAACAGEPVRPVALQPSEPEPLPVCEPAPEPPQALKPDLQPALREAHNLYTSGNLDAAMLAYERVLARAEEPAVQLNALIALALIRMMSSSRLQDLEAATLILEEIDKRVGRSDLYYSYFGQIELLRQIQSYQQRIANLHATNGSLKAELAKKEEAIRKLRELTVGGNLSP